MSEETSHMSDYLLVPMNVQAYVAGKRGDDPVYDLAPVPRTEDDVAHWYRDGKYSFSFQNSKLSQDDNPYSPGVHLHWALPAALTHSRHDGEGDPEQPCIPNRWLVVRMWHAAGNSTISSKKISSKAWVVESDFVSDNADHGGTPYPFFEDSRPAELNGKYCGYVGRQFGASDWNEKHPKYRFKLKSYGWGDPTFAAYYPACKGVLGFQDKLDGVDEGDVLTYLVIGWYSDPVIDPLVHGHGPKTNSFEDYKKLLASLGWSCADLDRAALPQRTLCHGAVVDLTWKGPNRSYSSDSFDRASTKVAIGGSAAEAFVTSLAPAKKQLQQVLCAFQHGQATQVSELHQLGDLLHRHGFAAESGGKLWTVEPANRSADAQSSPPPVSDHVRILLGNLNETQQTLDRHNRKIESLRSQLFACWVTWASRQQGPPLHRLKRSDSVDHAEANLKAAIDQLPHVERSVAQCRRRVTQALKTTGMQLVESVMPPFLHPKDPFVVLKSDHLLGPDRTLGRHQDEGAEAVLECRLVKNVVTGVSLSGVYSGERQAADCFDLDLHSVADVPPVEVTRKLGLEALLFGPNYASLFETGDLGKLFKMLQQSLENSNTLNGNTLTWKGQTPDPLGVTRWGDANPWLPVYFMWQAHWAPTYSHTAGNDTHSQALAGWAFDTDALAGDLVPGKESNKPGGQDVLLEGATILSPIFGKHLAKNLRDFAMDGVDHVSSLESIEQAKFLGQSLGGFNDMLLRQTLGLCLPPVDPTIKTVDLKMWEDMGRVQSIMPVHGTPEAGKFRPVRGGSLKIVNLYVVDSFGQTRKVIDSGPSADANPNVIASAALPSPPPEYHASFSPRLVQPTRLNFNWKPVQDDASNPVCGWIVANFLEKSFAVFSAGGTPLGALESVLPSLGHKTIESPMTFRWRPIPGSKLTVDGIDNAPLRRFMQLVTRFSADEGQAFFELVDLVLRKTDGRVPADDPALAVLLGRPLALVQASLELEIAGLPAGYWQSDSQKKLRFESEGFEKLRVPVRLGGMNLPTDGLVGYLPESTGCLVACDGAKVRLNNSNGIKYVHDLTVASRINYGENPTGDCMEVPPVSLTLLMDASARVHATTGILPRQSVVLPPDALRLAGLIQEVYFGVAPVLGARSRESVSRPNMPRPSDAFGQWSWATRPDLKANAWHEIKPSDDRARFTEGLALSEGWLKLRLQPESNQGNSTKKVTDQTQGPKP